MPNGKQFALVGQDEQFLAGNPASTLARAYNLPRFSAFTDVAAALVTQVMTSVAIFLPAGMRVTNLSFVSGATAAGTPTNWWFALYDTAATPNLLAQTADQTSTAWAADTVKTVALATAQVIPVDGIYWAACMVKATTVPSLMCLSVGRASMAGALGLSMSILAQNSGAALTATAPSTIATPTTQASIPWAAAN